MSVSQAKSQLAPTRTPDHTGFATKNQYHPEEWVIQEFPVIEQLLDKTEKKTKGACLSIKKT